MIRAILLICIFVLLLGLLRRRNTLRFQAGKKILFALFLIAAVVSVFAPQIVSGVAEALGVGRGTDLLLYAVVVAFAFVTANTYLKFKDLDERYTLLARRIAIDEATKPDQRGQD